MTLRTIIECDRCGNRCEYESIYAVVGTQTGVDSSEERYEAVDLCPLCMRALMARMVKEMDHEQALRWAAMAREKLKVIRM